MKKCMLLAVIVVFSSGVSAESVKVYEGKRQILTGPFSKESPPQLRHDEFRPVDHLAVYIENEYFRCCALPQLGGRLYEVHNKTTKTQLFFVNPYVELGDNYQGGHPWNLGGVEVNFPYFHHGNTYNDCWQWAPASQDDCSAGVVMSYTSRPTMQRVSFRVLLRPGVARVDLAYRFENLNPYSWGLAAWIDTMHPKTMETEFILPSPWMAQHGHNGFRTDLLPWPVRNGVDLSWQKNVTDLSEFSWMPRQRFTGCYDHALDRGAVRIFDPATLPAAKLWTSSPVSPDQYYQHFEIWTATSPVMEDSTRQPELSSYTGADSWYQVWGIGGYVYANEDLALNLRREQDGSVAAGVCGVRKIPGCVASVMAGRQTLRREVFTLDPASPSTWKLAAPPGDVTMDVVAPDGKSLAHYERIETEQPLEQWQMNKEPRWKSGINGVYYQEDYSTLWRHPNLSFDGAINGYGELLKKEPESTKLMLDLARVYLKDQQVRVGEPYGASGPEANADAAKRKATSLAASIELLQKVLRADPQNAHAHLFLGIALERSGKLADAAAEYRAALAAPAPEPAAGLYLAHALVKSRPGEAAKAARAAAQAYPQSSIAGHMLMAALIADDDQKEAVHIGQAMLGVDPADPLTTHLLAMATKKSQSKNYARETERLLAGEESVKKAFETDVKWLSGE